MLKRLRRQFILIVMSLVGAVLIAVLGFSYVGSYTGLNNAIDKSLERSLSNGINDRPVMGDMRPDERGGFGNMLGLVVEVSSDGIVLRTSNAPVVINTSILEDVVDRILLDGESAGRDKSAHVAWNSQWIDDDTLRIALVDTSSGDELLRNQALQDISIIVVALVVLFGISWWLSGWVLQPVERAWEQQRRFVSDASHELKTPLAVILANTQILQSEEDISEDAMRWIDSTADEANHMKSLVGDLLQLARADETAAGVSNNAVRNVDIDFSEMVESASLEFDVVAFERGCMIETDIMEGIHVQGDPEWLERLVRILIDNACKYGESGTDVTIRLAKSGSHAKLTVHNCGNPIDAEDLPHVFERFYRSDKARSREGEGGFGLGLAIAKGIVDTHGGTISVTSSEAEGTTFTVVL